MPEEPQEPAKPVETEKQTVNTWPRPASTTQHTSAAVVETAAHNSPGILVLQWLTYAFWGWTVLALTWLTAISVGFFIDSSSDYADTSSVIAYPLAAVVVLFVISLIADIFYSRVEPLNKRGAAMVIMIIHAVIFALFGIGALIAAVFGVVRLLIGDGSMYDDGSSGAITTLITGLIITVVYGATLLRTIRPFKLKRSALIYWVFMGVVSVAITTLAIVGPTWNAHLTRDDRLIERGLPQLSELIRNHTTKANALPATLSDVRDEAKGDVLALIDRNLVEYKPGSKVEINAEDASLSPERPIVAPDETAYNYTLCVTYKAKKGAQAYPAYSQIGSVTPETYYHEAGRVCYDLQTGYGGKYF